MPSSSLPCRQPSRPSVPFAAHRRHPALGSLALLACVSLSAPLRAQLAPAQQQQQQQPAGRGEQSEAALGEHAQQSEAAQRAGVQSEADVSGDSPEVKQLVATAIRLRADGKDREALAALRQAAQLAPGSLRVQVHLSNVYQALGEWLLADEYLRRALASPGHPYVQRHRQALAEARSVIDDHLGKLEVAGEPAGAEVLLNGKSIGTLPLSEPVPVTVGSYTLEVRLPGHYTVSRPLSIAAREHVRESIRLQPRPLEERSTPALAGPGAPEQALERPTGRPWLTWTLAGLGAAAAATIAGALIYRETHARRWNDDARCVGTERSREQLCGSERDKVETGDAWALGAGIATGVFAAAALLNVYVFVEEPGAEQAALAGCGLGPGGVSCFGSF